VTAASENPKLCVTLLRQNARLPFSVNSAFASVASPGSGVFGGTLNKRLIGRKTSIETGFTLIEVLVSMTILAIGISLGASLISKSLGNIRMLDARTRIIDQANSVMELTLLDPEIREPGSFEGDFEDGARWTVQIEEYIPDEALSEQVNMPVKLLKYTVEMFQPRSSAVDYRLSTMKLVPAQ
jgi:prepilin-type N-terminal cleavage/methylation domain-containing protein